MGHIDEAKRKTALIRKLVFFTSLTSLQVGIFSDLDIKKSEKAKKAVALLLRDDDAFKKLKSFFENLPMTSLTAPIVLTFRQVIYQINSKELCSEFNMAPKRALIV